MLSITALSIKYRTFTKPATADTMPNTDMLKGGELCFDYLSDDDHNSLWFSHTTCARLLAIFSRHKSAMGKWSIAKSEKTEKKLGTQYEKQIYTY